MFDVADLQKLQQAEKTIQRLEETVRLQSQQIDILNATVAVMTRRIGLTKLEKDHG